MLNGTSSCMKAGKSFATLLAASSAFLFSLKLVWPRAVYCYHPSHMDGTIIWVPSAVPVSNWRYTYCNWYMAGAQPYFTEFCWL